MRFRKFSTTVLFVVIVFLAASAIFRACRTAVSVFGQKKSPLNRHRQNPQRSATSSANGQPISNCRHRGSS